jgi:transposase
MNMQLRILSGHAVQGHINRIEMLRKTGYGHANPDPLRRRALLAN